VDGAAGDLKWNQTYTWHAQVKDANGGVTPAPPDGSSLTLLTNVPQPNITGHLASAPFTSQDRDFDPAVGNYSTAAVDASVSTAGPPLNVARTYNSLDPRTMGRSVRAGRRCMT